jgi:ABC-2 type transport system ATP-binding protein
VIGYMPDLAPVPSDLKVWEFLDFYADVHALGSRVQRRERVAECLEAVSLTAQRGSWCKQLSRGQTQRLVLAKTLLHRPRVMILDEPASGLDPLSRRELRLTLQAFAKDGATVSVSSHILSELAEMCSSLCVMNEGRLLASGTAAEVRRTLGRAERSVAVVVLERKEAMAEWLAAREGVHDVKINDGQIVFGFSGDDRQQAALLTGMVQEGALVKSFEEKSSSFEEILVEIAQENRSQAKAGSGNGNRDGN